MKHDSTQPVCSPCSFAGRSMIWGIVCSNPDAPPPPPRDFERQTAAASGDVVDMNYGYVLHFGEAPISRAV
jgi:hypothetical protein